MTGPATFSLFARHLPAQRGFLVAAGLADALDFLEDFHFDDAEIDYVRDTVGLGTASLEAPRGLWKNVEAPNALHRLYAIV